MSLQSGTDWKQSSLVAPGVSRSCYSGPSWCHCGFIYLFTKPIGFFFFSAEFFPISVMLSNQEERVLVFLRGALRSSKEVGLLCPSSHILLKWNSWIGGSTSSSQKQPGNKIQYHPASCLHQNVCLSPVPAFPPPPHHHPVLNSGTAP